MNTFGIDMQGLFSRIAVCEVNDVMYRLGNVSDGKRYAIPTFAYQDQWATQALIHESALTSWWAAATETTVSPNYNQPDFWTGLYNHLYHYLGWIEPCVTNGYNLAIGLQQPIGLLTSSQRQLENALEQAHFDSPVFLPATHCLLTKWLSSRPLIAKATFVTALAIGDESASLQTYELIPQRVGLQIHYIGDPVTLSSVKPIEWIKFLVNEATTQFSPSSEPPSRLTLLDFVFDYSRQLQNVAADRVVRLSRQISSQTFELCFSAGELAEKPAIRWPVTQILQALRKTNRSESSAKNTLLIGGTGAVWPFFKQALEQHDYSPWQSSDPALDIAQGAALFNKLPGLIWNEPINPANTIEMDSSPGAFPSNRSDGNSVAGSATSQQPPWAQRGEDEWS